MLLNLLTADEPSQAGREGHLVYDFAVCYTILIIPVTTTISH